MNTQFSQNQLLRGELSFFPCVWHLCQKSGGCNCTGPFMDPLFCPINFMYWFCYYDISVSWKQILIWWFDIVHASVWVLGLCLIYDIPASPWFPHLFPYSKHKVLSAVFMSIPDPTTKLEWSNLTKYAWLFQFLQEQFAQTKKQVNKESDNGFVKHWPSHSPLKAIFIGNNTW